MNSEDKPSVAAAPGPAASADVGVARADGGRRRRLFRIAIVAVPLLVVLLGLYYWFAIRPYETTDDAFIEGYVTPIAPQVAGRVARLLVDDNQRVNKDEMLVEIDPRDYEARLAQARARLAAAKAQFDQAKAQLTVDEAKAEQERAGVVAAEAEAERAQADLKRYEAVESRSVSRSQLDLAVAQARSTAAEVEVARNRQKAALAQATLSKANIETAAANIEQAEATVRQAELDLSYTRVVAPVDGFVTHRTVEVGAYVQTGQAMLALVPAQVWVVANFKETQLTYMRPGQRVEIEVDAYPHRAFQGHVDSIQRGTGARFSLLPPENAAGNYVKVVQRVPVKIVFDNPPDPQFVLGPGLSVVPAVKTR
jgi:membrane fusion protein (multidrug efflux system)